MNHFSESLEKSINALQTDLRLSRCEKLCLMVDIEGRFRVLLHSSSNDISGMEEGVNAVLKEHAGAFWRGEIWIEDNTASKADKIIFKSVWDHSKKLSEKFYLLQRRVSKNSWFTAKNCPPWKFISKTTPPIISFYSYKGGVGRSTSLASIAIQCARKGLRILAVDLDLEAPGLSSIFSPPDGHDPRYGIVDFILEQPVFEKNLPLDDFYYSYSVPKVVGDNGGEVIVVPAGRVDSDYMEKLARINYQKMENREQHPLDDLLRMTKDKLRPDLVLVDSRAGLHDLGGLALSSLAHRHVLFGLDSEQSWRGLQIAIRHLGRDHIEQNLQQQECIVVQCMASPKQDIREKAVGRFLDRAYGIFSTDYYDAHENQSAEYPVPDQFASDEPHYPVVLKHSEEIMGYNTVEEASDVLCSTEYVALAKRALPELIDK